MSDVIYKTGRQAEDSTDGLDFVMSDESVDSYDDVIEAAGWKLTRFKGQHANPVALYGHDQSNLPIGLWENVRVEAGRLLGRLKLAEPGTSPFIDAIRSLLAQKILRAVSVGFLPLAYEPRPGAKRGGYRYTATELIECSVVAVPANAHATAIRSLMRLPEPVRERLLAKSGLPQLPTRPPLRLPGKAAVTPPAPGPKAMSTLADRIREKETSLIEFKDAQAPLFTKIKEGDDLTDEEQVEFDAREVEITKAERDLGRMRATERALGQQADRLPHNQPDPAAPANLPMPGIARTLRTPARPGERPMDLLLKLAVVNLRAHAMRQPLEQVRLQSYPERTDVEAVIRTATNPANTTTAGWAAELVETSIADFMEALRPNSVYAQLAALGIKFSFDRNGVLKIPRRNSVRRAAGDLAGAFVGEGGAIPVRRGSFGSVSLIPHKMGVISTFTREMALRSNPAIEGLIREGIVEDTAIAVDAALLDAVAGDAIRPAGLMNGVTPIAGTAGGGVAAMTADIVAAVTPFTTANAADRLVWVMNPVNVFKLQWAASAVGVYPFRDQVAAGNLSGIPIIQSTAVGATDLILIRYADFASATGDTPEFDVSDQATIHEEDGGYPADEAMRPGTTTVLPIVGKATPPPALADIATPVRSLWQTASIGIRMLLDMDWAMRRAGMVVKVNNITW